ncbi:hypothetical protein HK100_003854 [Physocladia obscura]|uniref:LicD/FKTN/FKRP nucleotidyltransferase domain-containing protein n=1 Tax=Physocladia obscura TaxID=109957 RepID=A0AAD5SZK3_9FUNG|nr:hypothetical protein HK100_003854 [Physocladia obscura]
MREESFRLPMMPDEHTSHSDCDKTGKLVTKKFPNVKRGSRLKQYRGPQHRCRFYFLALIFVSATTWAAYVVALLVVKTTSQSAPTPVIVMDFIPTQSPPGSQLSQPAQQSQQKFVDIKLDPGTIFFSSENEPSHPLPAIETMSSDFAENFTSLSLKLVTEAKWDEIKIRLSAYDTGRYVDVSPSEFNLIQPAILSAAFDKPAAIVAHAKRDIKYFHECGIDQKRDARFANPKQCPIPQPRVPGRKSTYTPATLHDSKVMHDSLRALLDAWSTFATTNDLLWWISHGEMLGWFWNAKFLPWDHDLDIQVSAATVLKLANFNQTKINGRFLVDVAPNVLIRVPQHDNTIDSRIVDTQTGYYIDVTGLAKVYPTDERYYCKSPHPYRHNQIFPLIETVLEGVTVWRPRAVISILLEEYKERALTSTYYRPYDARFSYQWDAGRKEWGPLNGRHRSSGSNQKNPSLNRELLVGG